MERLYDLFHTLTPEGTVRSKPPGGTTYLYQWSEEKRKDRRLSQLITSGNNFNLNCILT